MATTTLAESLLDDLDDLSDVDEEEEEEEQEQQLHEEEGADGSGSGSGSGDNDKSEESKTNADMNPNNGDSGGQLMNEVESLIGGRKRLIDDKKFQSHLSAIQSVMKNSNIVSNSNANYKLMTTCNKYLSSLQSELTAAHHALIKAYKPKFPELDDLIPNMISYKNTIQILQNETDITLPHINHDLIHKANLNPNQIITLSVASSTTQGQPLPPTHLQAVNTIIAQMDQILHLQSELTNFVSSSMTTLAPNTCELIGPTLAARMVGLAGGMAEFAKIPACNLQVMGQVRHTASSRAGLSTSVVASAAAAGAASAAGSVRVHKPHEGMLNECELYSTVPNHLKRKALKVIAAKLALAIRCDFVNLEAGRNGAGSGSVDRGASGKKFKEEIRKKFHKLIEPDLAPVIKALPKPDLETKKRRGGKRMRLLKEQFEQSEMMKQANRRTFSSSTGEYGDDAMGLTLGMLESKKGSGNVRHNAGRFAVGNARKMRVSNTKAARKRAREMGMGGGGGAGAGGDVSGLASSMVFTPVQGLELVNPDAMQERVKKANQKWFSENSGFRSALPKKK